MIFICFWFARKQMKMEKLCSLSLHEKWPNTEFLVRIFPHSDSIHRDTSYLSVFSPNAGKYGPEITPMWTLFKQCMSLKMHIPLSSYSCVSIYLFCSVGQRSGIPKKVKIKEGVETLKYLYLQC